MQLLVNEFHPLYKITFKSCVVVVRRFPHYTFLMLFFTLLLSTLSFANPPADAAIQEAMRSIEAEDTRLVHRYVQALQAEQFKEEKAQLERKTESTFRATFPFKKKTITGNRACTKAMDLIVDASCSTRNTKPTVLCEIESAEMRPKQSDCR